MDSREFAEWAAYDQIELPDPYRQDTRLAQVCQTLVNVNRTKGSPVAKLSDFRLDWDVAPRAVASLMNTMRQWMRMFGAKKIKDADE